MAKSLNETPTTSFRFPPETRDQLARLQGAYPDPRGRPATAVDVVCLAVAKLYASQFPDEVSGTGKKSRKKA